MTLEIKTYEVEEAGSPGGFSLPESLAARLREIYEASFPPIEQIPFEALRYGVETGREFLLTLEDGEAVLAFATLRWIPSVKALYLEYLAVDPSARSRGLGGLLVDHAASLARKKPGMMGVILEVMSPDREEGEERRMRERRIGFYRRHGAEIVEDGGAYRTPDGFGTGVLFLRLLWIPTTPGASRYPEKNLRGFMTRFYEEVYGRDEWDDLLQEILMDLPD